MTLILRRTLETVQIKANRNPARILVRGGASSGGGGGGGAAIDITNTPAGNIAATNVQAAINELDTEKIANALLTTRGDLIRRGASAPERVALGASGYALKSDGTDAVWGPSREVLTANRTYYVRTDGSNSNTGLVDSAGGAFLTVQKAIDTILALDCSTYNVTIQIKDGTFTGANTINAPILGSGTFTIQGNNATPANVVISTTSADGFVIQNGATVTVIDMKVQTTTSGFAFRVQKGGKLTYGNLNYGAAATGHNFVSAGSKITCQSSYAISGGGAWHWYAEGGGSVEAAGFTITITGTPAFSQAFAEAQIVSSLIIHANTFSGSATGIRYAVKSNSVIFTNGGGASYVPGGTAGSTATGGQYI